MIERRQKRVARPRRNVEPVTARVEWPDGFDNVIVGSLGFVFYCGVFVDVAFVGDGAIPVAASRGASERLDRVRALVRARESAARAVVKPPRP